VEIGTAVSRALASLLVKRKRHQGTLLAAGSAAGISAGFGAPIAGVFFAVETVLVKDTSSIKGKESGVAVASLLLASVCAKTLSLTNMGAAPLFHLPVYSLETAELPLYWLLGGLSGLLCTAFAYTNEVRSRVCSHAFV
jgi:H+/Cl- antiporter ClcA